MYKHNSQCKSFHLDWRTGKNFGVLLGNHCSLLLQQQLCVSGGVAVGKSDKHPSYQETKDPGIREEGEHLGRKSNRYAATYLRSLRRRRFQLSEKCQMNNASGRLKSAKSFTH